MAFGTLPPSEDDGPCDKRDEAEQRARRDAFRLWRRRLARRTGRRITNRDIADLTGMSVRTVSRKWNGKTKITPRLGRELANIDELISAARFPDGCPEWLRRAIIERRLR